MFGLVVRFDIKPGCEADFDALAAETIKSIISDEPETFIYATHVIASEPRSRVFYELYKDKEAFDEHERQPHVRRFLAAREPLLDGLRVELLQPGPIKGLPDAGAGR